MEKITKTSVEALKPGEVITDSEIRGFRARRRSTVISYEFRYRTSAGRRKGIVLGTHGNITADEARRLAKKRAGEVADNRDPVAEQKAERNATANTVSAVWDDYMKRDVWPRRLRSADEMQRTFDRVWKPKIGDDSIYDLKKSRINVVLNGVVDNARDRIDSQGGRVMADRALAYLRGCFNWQEGQDDDFRSPIGKRMARTKPSEHKRERILDDQEIADVWCALDQTDVPDCYRGFIRATLLTGMRKANVQFAHRDEISGDRWIIPGEAVSADRPNRMKHKKDHLAPITPALQKLFGNRPGFLFSTTDGEKPFGTFGKYKKRLDAKIAEIRKAEGRKPMPHWTQHDLRRTARSIMSRYTTPDIAERVIGHLIGGVRGTYDLYQYETEKRRALQKLAAHIERVAHPRTGNVVTLPRLAPAASAPAAVERRTG